MAGDCNSEASSASGVRGRILSTSPGSLGAGVYGYNYGTGSNGVGVRGHHVGSGTGVYGRCDDGKGVYGYSANGYAGYFTGGKNYFEGKVGIGTTSPGAKLDVRSPGAGEDAIIAHGSSGHEMFQVTQDGLGNGKVFVRDASGGTKVQIVAYGYSLFNGGRVGIGVVGVPTSKLQVVGRTTTSELEITGGSDLSEHFDIDNSEQEIKPGMVVCIDPEIPGKLVLSSNAYDRKVAGIVSGAGGIGTGLLMGQKDSVANGAYPVALTGRVYCWADASNGSIQSGDLLTTSDMAGHAMKVTDYTKAQGAILGKAMSSLESGKGLVLVLVSLQ